MVEWARPLSARDAINRHNRFSDTGRGNTALLEVQNCRNRTLPEL